MESNKFLDLSYYKFRWVILVLHSNIEYQWKFGNPTEFE